MSTVTSYNSVMAASVTASDAVKTPSFLTRLMVAMMESRRRTAYREIARFESIYGVDLGGQALKTPVTAADLPFQR